MLSLKPNVELGFPEWFMFGVSMSGFQFEMGYGGEIDPNSDWWAWVHDPFNIGLGVVGGDLPENGPGYWSLFRKDHDLIVQLGLNSIRIGIEWSRIFPKPTWNVKAYIEEDEEGIKAIEVDDKCLEELDKLANKHAVQHYYEILSDLKNRDIHVTLCLNHFTLPLWIHDPLRVRDSLLEEGPKGWVSRETIVEFAKYAAYVAYRLGEVVDSWATFNESRAVAYEGYLKPKSGFPPRVLSFEAYFEALRNMVEAHARAYDMLKIWSPREIPVGIIYDVYAIEPLTEDYIDASKNAKYFFNWWFLDTVVRGELVLDYTFEAKRNPLIRKDLRNTVDWIGVNYYTRLVVEETKPWFKGRNMLNWRITEGYGFECEPKSKSLAGLPVSDMGWEVYPKGLRKVVNEVYKRYGIPVVVSENGIADAKDKLRPNTIVSHLIQLWKALNEDKVDVRGYYHWSLIDNYEWHHGFKMKFGLYAVNYDTKERIPRRSAKIYSKIAKEKIVSKNLVN